MNYQLTNLVRPFCRAMLVVWLCAVAGSAFAQIKKDEPTEHGLHYGEPSVSRFRVGAVITAAHGKACRNVRAQVAIPLECGEQKVKIVDENFSSHVSKVQYRTLKGGGVQQMVIIISSLAPGQKAEAIVTFEVETRTTLPPESTDHLKIPEKPTRKLKKFLVGSPFIETRNGRIRKVAREAVAELDESATDWQRVEAIYDYILDNIEYLEGPDKSALMTLRDKVADCQGRSALFVAICRSNKIPARLVWVHGHCYPEFYMEYEKGKGQWHPCESAGSRAFGEMPLARTVMQKGDNFRVPERPKERLRYATDFLIASKGEPKVKFIREQE